MSVYSCHSCLSDYEHRGSWLQLGGLHRCRAPGACFHCLLTASFGIILWVQNRKWPQRWAHLYSVLGPLQPRATHCAAQTTGSPPPPQSGGQKSEVKGRAGLWSFWELWRRVLPCSFQRPAETNSPWLPVVCEHQLISASVIMWLPPRHLCPLLLSTPIIGLQAHPNPSWPHLPLILPATCFQVRPPCDIRGGHER